jgi:glycerol-3-phosphate dehydrogenase
MFPHLNAPDLSGAVVFEDGQMYNPSRLVLAFIKSATATGAVACNYVQAKEFVWNGSSVRGVKAIDQLTGNEIEIRARLTLNAAGPWAEYLNRDPVRFGTWKRSPFSRDAYFIVDRQPTSPYALAVQGLSRDKDAVLARSNRHLFAVPWRKRTLLGVWHRFFTEQPDTAAVSPAEIDTWMAELNTVYPQLELQASEVTFANCGLVPFGDTATQTELSFGKESRYIDHRTAHGVAGLVTLVGIRFTTARADAARALDMLLQQRAVRPARAPTDRVALAGGNIESFEQLQRDAHRAYAPLMSTESLDALLRNYGTEHRQIVQRMQHRTELGRVVPGTHVLRAEIAHAVENEMAVHLDDVVLRRTDISADRHPGRAALDITAAAMGELLGWSPRRVREEIERTDMTLAKHLARDAEQLGTEHSPQTTSNGAMFAKITV